MRDMLKPYLPLVFLTISICLALYRGDQVEAKVLVAMLLVIVATSTNFHELKKEQQQLRARIIELEALTLENGSAQGQGHLN